MNKCKKDNHTLDVTFSEHLWWVLYGEWLDKEIAKVIRNRDKLFQKLQDNYKVAKHKVQKMMFNEKLALFEKKWLNLLVNLKIYGRY